MEDKGIQVVPTPQLLKVSNEPEITRETLQKAPGRVKLLLDPLFYAEGAVACITDQLKGVKSPKRKLRLESKLQMWNKVIEVLTEEANVKPKESTESSGT